MGMSGGGREFEWAGTPGLETGSAFA